MVGQAGDKVNGAVFATEAEIGIEVAHRGAVVFVVPRLICRQGERVRKDTGNTVKFAQMIGVGDGRGP